MTNTPRWSVADLLVRYDLEPHLRDVFVEGPFDKDVLSFATRETSSDMTFYEIDVVDVPSSLLQQYGLTSGNKQRVIALARELGALSATARVFCLADKDLDHWFGALPAIDRLRWTQFCSLELHFLASQVVADILVTTGRARFEAFHEFFVSLTEVLKDLYALRLADRACGLALTWVSLRKYLSRAGDVVSFASSAYVVALLSSNSQSKRQQEFDNALRSWRGRLVGDSRQCVRGHDYLALLAWAMREFDGEKEFASERSIERLLVLLGRTIPGLTDEVQ